MKVLGIDLSGPCNTADTVCTLFEERDSALRLVSCHEGADDGDIVDLVAGLMDGEICQVGLDAPLSYNPGGGDRPADKALRKAVMAKGLSAGSVMVPTMTRMVYLTLRGMAVARLLEGAVRGNVRVVEVHPGAALALGGAPVEAVGTLKSEPAARQVLLQWLAGEGLQSICRESNPSDHYVAACACALGAWKWAQGRSSWLWPACPPHHPYDFCC